MKKQIKSLLCGLCAAALALGCAGCGGSAGSEVPAKVTDITVWTYYNGDQLESFNSLVNQFNETVGAQKGIKVSTESQGSVNDLETSVMDSAEGKVGASAMPNIFSAYADTAYALDQMGMVMNLAPYLTEEEKAQFVEATSQKGTSGRTTASRSSRWQNPPSCCSSMIPTGRPLPMPPVSAARTLPPWRG